MPYIQFFSQNVLPYMGTMKTAREGQWKPFLAIVFALAKPSKKPGKNALKNGKPSKVRAKKSYSYSVPIVRLSW